MPRNASGVYSKPAGSTAITGTTIDAAAFNTLIDDIVADLNLVRPVVAGGTGAPNASDARTELGLDIGSDVLAYDAGVQALSGNTPAADRIPYYTGASSSALAVLSAYARSLMSTASEADFKAFTNLEIGVDVQPYDVDLATIAGVTFTTGDLIYHNGTSLNRLPPGANGRALFMNAGVPTWLDFTPVTILDIAWGRPTGAADTTDYSYDSTHVGTISIFGQGYNTTSGRFDAGLVAGTTPSGTWTCKGGALTPGAWDDPQPYLWARTA